MIVGWKRSKEISKWEVFEVEYELLIGLKEVENIESLRGRKNLKVEEVEKWKVEDVENI